MVLLSNIRYTCSNLGLYKAGYLQWIMQFYKIVPVLFLVSAKLSKQVNIEEFWVVGVLI